MIGKLDRCKICGRVETGRDNILLNKKRADAASVQDISTSGKEQKAMTLLTWCVG